MARVFLFNPPTSEPIRTPLLSLAYLASALQRAGHDVGLLDASAVHAPRGEATILGQIRQFGADLVGLHVKTLYVQDARRWAQVLRDGLEPAVRLVAGGPHPTVAPGDLLAAGCDFEVLGEGEETLTELADALDGKRDLHSVRSLLWRDEGRTVRTPDRGFLPDLDALASPVDALPLFDPAWYGATGPIAFGGLLSSRGCPAACTFCCNNVTGRRFRYRSAEGLAHEIRRLRDHHGMQAFTFLDDSFAVGRRRVTELADSLEPLGPLPWACTAHPSHLDPSVLQDLRRAGCGGVDIGMESGDPERLKLIGKGVTVERVLQVAKWCQDADMHLVINLMFGWPHETDREIDTTLRFLDQAAALGAMFNARGVLVPYPGTAIYDEHHRTFGFSEWWLRDPPLDYAPFPTAWDEAEILRAYASDAALDRNYFQHTSSHLRRIAGALQSKADATWARVRARQTPTGGVPAAGAR